MFRETTVYLNGQNISSHSCGYTSFAVRLDNETALKPAGQKNTLALFVDPEDGAEGGARKGSGWWYGKSSAFFAGFSNGPSRHRAAEGGGIYRHVHLVKADHLHIEQDGLFAYANITGAVQQRAHTGLGLSAASAVLHASAAVVNDGKAAASFCAKFTLSDASGKQVGSGSSAKTSVEAGEVGSASVSISVSDVELWTTPAPYLYDLVRPLLS